jgi:hypothetical protein
MCGSSFFSFSPAPAFNFCPVSITRSVTASLRACVCYIPWVSHLENLFSFPLLSQLLLGFQSPMQMPCALRCFFNFPDNNLVFSLLWSSLPAESWGVNRICLSGNLSQKTLTW